MARRAFGDSDIPQVPPLSAAGEPHVILPHEEAPRGAAAVLACEEVRASTPGAPLRPPLHARFAPGLDSLEPPWHEPPGTCPAMTATVWHVRPPRTGGRTEARGAPVHKRELTALSPCSTPSSCRLLLSVRGCPSSLFQPGSHNGFLMSPTPWTTTEKTMQTRKARLETGL